MAAPLNPKISTNDSPVLYFGYGSNLWLAQMRGRCPTARFLGLARLNNFHWIISSRGYANVVELRNPPASAPDPVTDVAYGLVYSLLPEDESRLDVNEGVPFAYTKEMLEVDYWPLDKYSNLPDHIANGAEQIDVEKTAPQKVAMLVYIDRERTSKEFEPKEEYIVRMNHGVEDAVAHGVPREYVEKVIRRWIPETSPEDAKEKAAQQAAQFVDENVHAEF